MNKIAYKCPGSFGTNWVAFQRAMQNCNLALTFTPLNMMTPAERARRFAYNPETKPTQEELKAFPHNKAKGKRKLP